MFNKLKQKKALNMVALGIFVTSLTLCVVLSCKIAPVIVPELLDPNYGETELNLFRERNGLPLGSNNGSDVNLFIRSQFEVGMSREEVHDKFQSLGATEFEKFGKDSESPWGYSEFASITLGNSLKWDYIVGYDDNLRLLGVTIVD